MQKGHYFSFFFCEL